LLLRRPDCLRTELFDNFKVKVYSTEESDEMLLERLQLDFNYQLQDNLSAFIQLQDAHFWFFDLHLRDFGDVCPYENPLDLKKGYVEWTHINDTPLGFRVGRQAISYRDERVLGPGDWGNTGRYTWDALKLLIDTETVSTELIGAQRVISDKHTFDDTHFDFDAYGIYSQINKLPFALDLLYIFKYDDHGTTVDESGIGDLESHSIGAYADGRFLERWDWGGLAVYQFGNWGDDDIKALGSNERLGYTFDTAWKPRIGVEHSYGSGDDDPNDGDHKQFDGQFGAVDKFYGRMNMFAWMNLHDYQTSFSVKPKKNLDFSLDYHYLQLAEEEDGWHYCHGKPIRQDPIGSSNDDLGHEVNLLANVENQRAVRAVLGIFSLLGREFCAADGRVRRRQLVLPTSDLLLLSAQ